MMQRLRILPFVLALTLTLAAGASACVVPSPPPTGPVEFLDSPYQYDPATTCRNADVAAPFNGSSSYNAVASIDDAGQAGLLAQADDAWTSGDHAAAKALARTAGNRPAAVDIYRPSGAAGP